HAAPAATPAGRAPPSDTPPSATASTPAVKHEGKGEFHLGSHTLVESPAPETATSAHEPSAANPPVPALRDPSASESQRINATSGAAVAAAPTPATQGMENIRHWEEDPRSSREQAPEIGAQKGVSSLGSEGMRLASLSRLSQTANGVSASNGTPTIAAGTSAKTNPSDSRTHEDANSSTPVASFLTANGVVATPDAAASRGATVATLSPVADQLTQAFLAHANVVQHTGRSDFHLNLDPPQLGSVRIHLTATQHTVSARIVVAQEGTRQLLAGQAHHLRQGLAEAGLSLGSFDVARDGGGSNGGGQQPPPQTPLAPPTTVATPRTTTVVSTSVSRPMDGINILA
ncbi:MAG: flagellar hook-length control protein FliK, partial [Gemmataceae bacterium]